MTDATFSPDMRGGRSPGSSPASKQMNLFGQEAAPVRLSAARARKNHVRNAAEISLSLVLCKRVSLYASPANTHGMKMTDTLCPNNLDLSPADDLIDSMANRLAQQLPTGGMTEFLRSWELRVTPWGGGVLPAACVGGLHGRKRLWFMAYAGRDQCARRRAIRYSTGKDARTPEESEGTGLERFRQINDITDGSPGCSESLMGNAGGFGQQWRTYTPKSVRTKKPPEERGEVVGTDIWDGIQWISCPDGKQRPIKPGIQFLVNGYPERDGLIHAAGDGIVPQVAAAFIKETF